MSLSECHFLLARGGDGIDFQKRKKLKIPGGVPRGDRMVTNQIEPRITW